MLRPVKSSFFRPIWVFGVLLAALGAAPMSGLAQDVGAKVEAIMTPEAPWEIFGDELSYDSKTQVYVAKGHVVITKAGQSLYAQEAVYNQKTAIAEASGNVRLESGGDTFSGDHAVFNLQTQTGRITNGVLFLKQNHYYISGKVMEKLAADTYLIKDAQLTTCDGPDPAWSITGNEVKVTIEGYGTIKSAALRLKDLPFLYVPYMLFPAKSKRQTGLLPPRAGYSTLNGAQFEIPFFWAISDQVDATFYQRYMSSRGYMQGLELNYILDPESKGTFLFDILNDSESPKDMSDSDALGVSPLPRTNQTRYWLRGRLDQTLPSDVTARLDADFVSDQDYLREFDEGPSGFDARPDLAKEWRRPFFEAYAPLRRSSMRLAADHEDYSLQGGSSYYQRPEDLSEDDTAQPLGDLFFSLLPRKYFSLPLVTSLGSDYTYVWRDSGEKGHRFSLSPEAQVPLFLGRYMELVPSFFYLYNSEWFRDALTNENANQSNRAYEAAVSLATNVDRIYDVDWLGAKRLKHKVRPVLSYEYRSLKYEDQVSPWFETIDQLKRSNVVVLGLENFLDARLEDSKGNISYSQWATFELSQGYDLDEVRNPENPADKRPFTPLEADLTLRPIPSLDLRGNAQWDHYERQLASTTLSLDLTVPRAGGLWDYYQLDYRYLKEGQKNLNFIVDVNLTYGLWAGTSLERDLDARENIRSRYWLGYRRQCWGTKVFVENTDADTKLGLMVELLGLGQVGGGGTWSGSSLGGADDGWNDEGH